ncbi:MAG: histidine kinase [Rhodoglobus sp.]
MIDSWPRIPGRVVRFWQRHPLLSDSFTGASWVALNTVTLLVAASAPTTTAPVFALLATAVLVIGVAITLLRRRRPVVAYAICLVASVPFVLVDPGVSTLAGAYCIFAIAVYDSARRAWQFSAVSATLIVVIAAVSLIVPMSFSDATAGRLASAATYAGWALLVVMVALFWGLNVGHRRRYINDLIDHARQLERDRDQQAQLAALAERSRIARDIHDIVSHSLSVIVRLSDGAQAVFDREPQRAREAIAEVARVGRSSLTEMRRVMGVLESAPHAAAMQSGTGYDDLAELVAVYRGIGLPVELTVTGNAPAESGVQMTVFRVVQEALTNALRHSTTPSIVNVRVDSAADVTVSVHNDGVRDAAPDDDHVGRGLLGMRERAALYGGTLTAGVDEGRDWTVRLVLPGVGR